MCRWLIVSLLLVLAFATPLRAHFNLNVNLRVVHIDFDEDGAEVMLRLPMAYLVADKLGPTNEDGSATPAPYTRNRIEDDQLMHYLDADALRQDAAGLARIAAAGHELSIAGVVATPEFVSLRAFPALSQSPFSTWAEAEQSFAGPIYDPTYDEGYVGDTIVDVRLRYHWKDALGPISIRSHLDPGLEQQDDTANLIVIRDGVHQDVLRVRGVMHEPIVLSRSRLEAWVSFVRAGIAHIIEGLDHVLFVVCLVIGASSIIGLMWRVTGFTLGHSITLALGFFGYVPKGPWFVPLVEAAIALSIVVAALMAIGRLHHRNSIAMTTAMGLLHGLGFSFFLTEILRIDASNRWSSLLGFNVGVELGQVLIVGLCWPLLWLTVRMLPIKIDTLRIAVALPIMIIAAVWFGERLLAVVGTIG